MPSLSELLIEIEDDVKVQFLGECQVKVQDKKRTADTEITFATNEVNCNDFFRGDKVGIVIWASRTKYNNAMRKLLEKKNVVN